VVNNKNLEIVQECYKEMSKGDIQHFVEHLSPNVEWRNPGDKSNGSSFSGTYHGRKEVREYFDHLYQYNEFSKIQPRDFISDNDKVIVTGYMDGKSRLTGKKFKSDWVSIWTLKDGYVERSENFSDQLNIVESERPNKDNLGMIDRALVGLECFETGNSEREKYLLSENFQFIGPMPMPLTAKQYQDMAEAIHEGIPDWCFNVRDIRVDGNNVFLTVRITGTQTGTLRLPIPNFDPIKATSKKIALPDEVLQLTFKNNKIEKIYVKDVPGGGIEGLLNQLGYKLPQMR
jgi:ketosteroid isomerase-like protein/predicted ester cyclase